MRGASRVVTMAAALRSPAGGPGALAPALWRSVMDSKEARRSLAGGGVPVTWLDLTAADEAVAAALDGVRGAPARCDHGADGWAAFNAATRREYETLYAPGGLDPANNELAGGAAAAVCRGLGLGKEDAFVDLGSSAGSLVLAAAAATAAARCHGVELSDRGHGIACDARDRFAAAFPGGGDRVAFFRSDCRDAPLADYDVLFCAIRGVAARPAVTRDVLDALLASGGTHRLVCAGYGVDVAGAYGGRVSLARATVLRRPDAAPGATDYEASLPLYGEGEGPRVLLEYAVAPA